MPSEILGLGLGLLLKELERAARGIVCVILCTVLIFFWLICCVCMLHFNFFFVFPDSWGKCKHWVQILLVLFLPVAAVYANRRGEFTQRVRWCAIKCCRLSQSRQLPPSSILLKYTMKSTGLDYLKAEYVVHDHITQGHAMNQQGRARKNLVHRFCSVAQILGLGSF